MIYIFLADGFEEIEALSPIDALRRAGIKIKSVGIGKKQITGAHSIEITADIEDCELDYSSVSGIILPGGMPGTTNLAKSDCVKKCLDICQKNHCLIGAICAAPSVLGGYGLLDGKKATCFPGFEDALKGADVTSQSVVRDQNIITAKGAGVAWEFAFKIIEFVIDEQTAQKIAESIQCRK